MRKKRFKYNPRGITRSQFLVLTGALVVLMGSFIYFVSQQDKLPPDNGNYVAVTEGNTVDIVSTPQVAEESKNEITYVRDSCYNDPNNSVYPYNLMSADWGGEVYEDGYSYYSIPKDLKDRGGCLPEVVQVYLWCTCKEYNVDYPLVLAIIERESKYKWDATGDDGDSKGYMQIYEKWHTERMERLGVTDLYNPYQNILTGVDTLKEIQEEYLASSGANCVLMVYNMGETTAKKNWSKGIYSTEYSREILTRAQEIKQEVEQD